VKDRIYRTFGERSDEQTLQHGHTFCGNPIAAAAALASLDLMEELDILADVRRKAALLRDWLAPAAVLPQVREVRCLGLIGAIELQPERTKRGAETRPQRVRRLLFERGVLMRPLGNVVYLLPPLVITDRDLRKLAQDYLEAIRHAG
jgi:adenosylmethionine-8-amino-7-oxononanoate aminotransferase